jgi:hypothetical protein
MAITEKDVKPITTLTEDKMYDIANMSNEQLLVLKSDMIGDFARALIDEIVVLRKRLEPSAVEANSCDARSVVIEGTDVRSGLRNLANRLMIK